MKTGLLAALIVSSAVFGAVAQTVVGYVSVPLTNGFNLVANPLDFDRTGTNNYIAATFGTSLPANSQIYKFSGGGYTELYAFARGSWTAGASNATINPGEGVFISVPTNTNFTFVGYVLLGHVVNQYISPGVSLLGSKIPLQGGLQTVLQYVPTDGDTAYFFDQGLNGGLGGYHPYAFSTRSGWVPAEPQVNPGMGFFLITANANPSWVQNFTLQGVQQFTIGQSRPPAVAASGASPKVLASSVDIKNLAAQPDGAFRFAVCGNPHQITTIEATTTPDDAGSWTTISTVVPADGTFTFTDVNAGQFKSRFYRISQ